MLYIFSIVSWVSFSVLYRMLCFWWIKIISSLHYSQQKKFRRTLYNILWLCSFTVDGQRYDVGHNDVYSRSISWHHQRYSAASEPRSRLLWPGPCRTRLHATLSASIVVVCRLYACSASPETARSLRACADRRAGAAIQTATLPVGAGARTTGGQHRTNAHPGSNCRLLIGLLRSTQGASDLEGVNCRKYLQICALKILLLNYLLAYTGICSFVSYIKAALNTELGLPRVFKYSITTRVVSSYSSTGYFSFRLAFPLPVHHLQSFTVFVK